MSVFKAFVNASSGAYILMAIMAAIGRPLMIGPTVEQQVVFSLVSAGAIQLPSRYKWLRIFFVPGYGMAAMAAFSGVTLWAPAGSQVTGPAMALWDLLLAVAMSQD